MRASGFVRVSKIAARSSRMSRSREDEKHPRVFLMTTPPTAEQPLIDAIFLDKVRRARRTPIGEKVLDGPRLFDQNCQLMRGAIRTQFPEFDDGQVELELRRRLAIARRIDEAGIYTNVDENNLRGEP